MNDSNKHTSNATIFVSIKLFNQNDISKKAKKEI